MRVSNYIHWSSVRKRIGAAVLMVTLLGVAQITYAQTIGFERARGSQILDVLKGDIKKNYYDPNFHGIDLDARFKAAHDKIDQASSVGQIQAIIAQVLVDFDDSHLYFAPPRKASRTEYGWRMQMIGDKCFITAVQPGSDAEAKGLKPGDEVYSWDGFEPTRDNLWKIQYFYYQLRPKPVTKLVIIKPDNKQVELEVKSKVKEGPRIMGRVLEDFAVMEREEEEQAHLERQRYYDNFKEVFIWKMPQFDLADGDVDGMMDRASGKALILDLRGNGGGLVTTLKRLVGNFFDHDVKIGDRKGRKEMKPDIAKSRGGHIFKGQVAVLIDSRSGSAAELFARTLQIEKRGKVIGDRSAGAVMEAMFFPHESGTDFVAFYGASVTIADLIMSDGKSLEKTGVIPDELLLPSATAMAAGRDPVLAYAARMFGAKLTSEEAGSLFPVEWKKQ